MCELRPAYARTSILVRMSLCLNGMTIRKYLLGVTGIVLLLDFFHSPDLDQAR